MADHPLLEIRDLLVCAADSSVDGNGTLSEDQPILEGVSLRIEEGEIHGLFGPAASGKSTLAKTILGSEGLIVTDGSIRFKGEDVTTWPTDIRAKAGMFLAFQNPAEIEGLSTLSLLQRALTKQNREAEGVKELHDRLDNRPDDLQAGRADGELLQMEILEPRLAIIDQADGPDTPATGRLLARSIQAVLDERPSFGALSMSRHPRLLDHLQADHIHVLRHGRIVASGGRDLAKRLVTDGYESFT